MKIIRIKIILLILLTLSLPALAQEKEDFPEVNIEPAFQECLYSQPDFMQEGGARVLEIKGPGQAIIGIGKAFPEPSELHDTPKLTRICEIHAKTAILELGRGINVSTVRGAKEDAAFSSFFQATETSLKGKIEQLPIIGTWWSKNHAIFYAAVGKIITGPNCKNLNGRSFQPVSTGTNNSLRMRNMEGKEPFLSILCASPVFCKTGGVRGFMLEDNRKVLLAVGSALIKDSYHKAEKIARLKAMRSLLGLKKGVQISSVEYLADQEHLSLSEKGEKYLLLSQFFSVKKEKVKGIVKVLPVVATWEDKKGEALFVAIGSTL